MSTIWAVGIALARARRAAGLSQRELAQRARTAQPNVARIERGQGNPTLRTLERLFEATDRRLLLHDEPLAPEDAVVEAYKRDVDRSLIRENLLRSAEDRLRLNAEILELTASARRSALRTQE
jgi:transcriptional regulator with XRE-family HTH domain